VHVNVLARLFSGKMLAMLTDAHDAGQLKFFNTHAGLADTVDDPGEAKIILARRRQDLCWRARHDLSFD